MNIKVSIVIPTYRRQNKLVKLLKSISEGDFDKIEVIIVNDDPQFKYTEDFLKNIVNLQIIIINNNTNVGLNMSRYIGGLKATGEYILFIDDDNVVEKNTVSTLYNDFEELSESVAALAPIAYYYSNTDKIWWCGTILNKYTLKSNFIKHCDKKYIETHDVHNAFMIRRKYLDHVGITTHYFKRAFATYGFVTLLRKRGLKAFVDTSAKIFHDVPYNTSEDREVKLYELIGSRFDEDRIFHYFYEPLIYSKMFSDHYLNVLLNTLFQYGRLQIYTLAIMRSNLTLSQKRKLILYAYKGFVKGILTKVKKRKILE